MKMLATCLETAPAESTRCSAIWVLLNPRAMSSSTSRSRWVNASSAVRRPVTSNVAISGSMTTPPAATMLRLRRKSATRATRSLRR